MSKIIVDQIQSTGGTAFSLPATDGGVDYNLKTDGSGNLSWVAPAAAPAPIVEDTHRIVGTVVSGSSRDNVYSSGEWSSQGPWTSYYNTWQDVNSRIQGINMFMGDGYPNTGATTQNFYVNDGMHNESRKLEFAHNSRVGFRNKDYFEYDNNTTAYSGIHIRALPVRNTTGADITRSIGVYASAYDNAYGGAAFYSFVPDAENYSEVTGGTWTDLNTATTSSSQNNFGVTSVVIPAGKTTILFLASSTVYQTTYRMKSTSMFYNVDTFFPVSEDIVCDLRMLYTLERARIPEATYSTDNFYKVYEACNVLFGDRA